MADTEKPKIRRQIVLEFPRTRAECESLTSRQLMAQLIVLGVDIPRGEKKSDLVRLLWAVTEAEAGKAADAEAGTPASGSQTHPEGGERRSEDGLVESGSDSETVAEAGSEQEAGEREETRGAHKRPAATGLPAAEVPGRGKGTAVPGERNPDTPLRSSPTTKGARTPPPPPREDPPPHLLASSTPPGRTRPPFPASAGEPPVLSRILTVLEEMRDKQDVLTSRVAALEARTEKAGPTAVRTSHPPAPPLMPEISDPEEDELFEEYFGAGAQPSGAHEEWRSVDPLLRSLRGQGAIDDAVSKSYGSIEEKLLSVGMSSHSMRQEIAPVQGVRSTSTLPGRSENSASFYSTTPVVGRFMPGTRRVAPAQTQQLQVPSAFLEPRPISTGSSRPGAPTHASTYASAPPTHLPEAAVGLQPDAPVLSQMTQALATIARNSGEGPSASPKPGETEHRNFVLAVYLLQNFGKDPGLLVPSGQGGMLAALQIKLRYGKNNYTEYGITSYLHHSTLVHLLRVEVSKIEPSLCLPQQAIDLFQKVYAFEEKEKGVTRPLDSLQVFDEAYKGLFALFSLVYGPACEASWLAFLQAVISRTQTDPLFDLADAVAVLKEALIVFEATTGETVSSVMRVWKDTSSCAPGKSWNQQHLKLFVETVNVPGAEHFSNPYDAIEVNSSGNVLHQYVQRAADLTDLQSARLARESLKTRTAVIRGKGAAAEALSVCAATALDGVSAGSSNTSKQREAHTAAPKKERGEGSMKRGEGSMKREGPLTKGELLAASKESGEVCLRNLSHFGCTLTGCTRSHTRPSGELSKQVQLALISWGGDISRPAIPAPDRAARMEALRLQIHPSRGKGFAVPHDISGSAASTHPREQQLAALSRPAEPSTLYRVDAVPQEPLPAELALSAEAEFRPTLEAASASAFSICPKLGTLEPNVASFVVALFSQYLKHEPQVSLTACLVRAAKHLDVSSLPGAVAGAEVLRRSVGLTHASGSLTASRQHTPLGSPMLVTYPSPTPKPGEYAIGSVSFMDEIYTAVDLGQTIVMPEGTILDNQCVLLCLAYSIGLPAHVLVTALRQGAADIRRSLAPLQNVVSPEALHALQCAHDLFYNPHQPLGSIDFHSIRYLCPALFRHHRFFAIVCAGSSQQVELHVLHHPDFQADEPGCKTHISLITEGHARALVPTKRLSSGLPREVRSWNETALGSGCPPAFSIEPACAAAFLATAHTNGLAPRYFPFMSITEIEACPQSLPVSALAGCPHCNEVLYFQSTRAGRRSVCPWEISASTASWAAQYAATGGFGASALEQMARKRGSDYPRFAGLSSEEVLNHPLPPTVRALAEKLLSTADATLVKCSKAELKAKSPLALQALAVGILSLARITDSMVLACKSLRLGCVALRQVAWKEGRRALDTKRIQPLREVVDPELFFVLEQLSEFGVPVLQVEDIHPGTGTPYSSAADSAVDLLYAAVEDIARGGALILTKETSAHILAEAGAVFHRLGAVPKLDDEGDRSGMRAISDLRLLNAATAAQAPARRKTVAAEPPPARYPRIVDAVRTIIRCFLRCPGLAILLSLIDLSAAFKLLHLHIADAPSQATELPWGELEDALRSLPPEELAELELFLASLASDVEPTGSSPALPKGFDPSFLPSLIAVYFLLVFGARDNPGWMTVAASAVTQASSRTGVPVALEKLVGNLPAYFLALMDDALVIQSGEFASRLAVAIYRYRATQCFGEHCINESKFQTNGTPAPQRKVWGYMIDTSPLADLDPASPWLSVYDRLSACTVSTPENKNAKMTRLLMDEAYQHLEDRRVTLKQHRSAAGLLNFLAGPSMVLRWLLTSFHVMSASTDNIWVSPSGSESEVNHAWNLYATTRELILLTIADKSIHQASAGTFTSTLVSALTVQERVALGAPLVHVGSDACWEVAGNGAGSGQPAGDGGMSFTCHLNHVVAVGSVREFSALLGRLLELDRRTIIYVGELMPLVAGFMLFGATYVRRLLAWAVDNDPSGLSFGRCGSRHPYAQYLHGVAIRIMSMYGFVCSAMYVNTVRNPFNDTMSRLFMTASRAELLDVVASYYPGYRLVDLEPVFRFLCTEGTSSPFSFVLFGETDPTLARSVSRRRPLPRSLLKGASLLRPSGSVVEVFAGIGQLSLAAQTFGFTVAGIIEPNEALSRFASKRLNCSTLKCLADLGKESLSELGPVELLLVANPPRRGFKIQGTKSWKLIEILPKLVRTLDPLAIVAEIAPGQLADEPLGLSGLDAALKEAGYVRLLPPDSTAQELGVEVEVNSKIHVHCGQQRVRHVLHFEKAEMADNLGELQELNLPSGPPKTLKDSLVAREEVPDQAWLKETVMLDESALRAQHRSRASEVKVVAHCLFPGEACGEPRPGGLIKIKGSDLDWVIEATEGKEVLLVSPEKSQTTTEVPKKISRDLVVAFLDRKLAVKGMQGIASVVRTKGHFPEGPGNNLVYDEERGNARRLLPQEVWALQGLTKEHLSDFRSLNPRASGNVQAQTAGLAVHTESAYAYVERAGKRIAIIQAKLQLHVVDGRFQRLWPCTDPWGRGDDQDEESDKIFESSEENIAHEDQSRAAQIYEAALVGHSRAPPGGNTRASGGPRRERSAAIHLGADMAHITRLASSTLIASSLSLGTRSTYASMLRHFFRFRYVRNEPPLPMGRDPALDQQTLITFVAYMGLVMCYAHSTVRVILYSLRRACLENELPDPLSNAPLLMLSLKGLKRMQGGPRRKVAASIDLIRYACMDLDLNQWDQLMLALAMVLMYIFLLRSREALRKGTYPDPEQCLRVRSIILACQGEAVTGKSAQVADEVVLLFGKSKADQEGQGSVHNAFESPGERLCVVRLLKKAYLLRPRHFQDGDRFLFELQDGRVLHRDVVEKKLRKAAQELGMPPEALGVISLRAGGASALWDMSTPIEAIKRRGRWASDSWKAYVWEGREKSRELAAQMMKSSFSMLASLARYSR